MAIFEFILHLDRHVAELIRDHGAWTYAILFGIVFVETGFVIAPFLPGDSLLFAAGMFSNSGAIETPLNIWLVSVIFIVAAFLGDNMNYQIGRFFGQRAFQRGNSRVFRRENLEATHRFLERHGPAAIIIARFVPFIRTFMPFVCGMGSMTFPRFLLFSLLGAIIWVVVCCGAGYLFGTIPVVQDNFGAALLIVIVAATVLGGLKAWLHRRKQAAKIPAK